jgi:branched-chain amino acid transport system substrate-binding protein
MFKPTFLATMLAVVAAQAAPKQITLGAALPLTGAEAKSGNRVRDGYELAVQLVNQQGGMEMAGARVPVKLNLADDKSDGAEDQRAVEQLVAQGADVILGTFGSSLVEKGSATAEKHEIPYVAPTGASRALYQRGFKYLFGLQSPIDQLANALMRWAEEEQQKGKLPASARVAILWEKTSHGKEYAEAIKDFASKTPRRRAAWNVVMDESFELNTKDFKPLLEKLKTVNADAVMVDAHLPDYITMHGQYAKMGICHKVISYGARGPEREARDQLKSGSDYVLSAVWWSDDMAQNAQTSAFVKKFQERYNRSPDWYEALGYEAVRVSLEAIRRAGSADHPAVRNALSQIKVESLLPGGYLAFPEQYGNQAQYLFVVQQNLPDGSSPVIYPRIAALREGVAPNPTCSGSKLAGK